MAATGWLAHSVRGYGVKIESLKNEAGDSGLMNSNEHLQVWLDMSFQELGERDPLLADIKSVSAEVAELDANLFNAIDGYRGWFVYPSALFMPGSAARESRSHRASSSKQTATLPQSPAAMRV